MMKKIFYLFFAISLILFSCKTTPEARFLVDNIEPAVGQAVNFTNDSHNGTEFEWDFGDGYGSNEENPTHVYTATGTYDVVLTVWSRSGLESKATITITVMVPTLLVIEVVEYYDEYIVPDASVRLYGTLPDWEDETNMIDEGFTDEYGVAVFSHLDPFVYYVDVWETNHDNYTLATEDVGFIRTNEVLPNKINWFIAWVDLVDHGKCECRRDEGYVVKKLERKYTDKELEAKLSEADWKELYDKSIKVKKPAVSK